MLCRLVVPCALVALASAAASAQSRVDAEIAIHLKVLSFDRSLVSKARKPLRVAVVHRPAALPRGVLKAFTTLARRGLTVHRRPVQVRAVPLTGNWRRLLLRQADVVFVAGDIGNELGQIIALKLPTLCRTLAQVRRGVAVGVVGSAGRPRIVINVAAARAARMRIDPKLLRLATLIR